MHTELNNPETKSLIVTEVEIPDDALYVTYQGYVWKRTESNSWHFVGEHTEDLDAFVIPD